MQRPSFTLSQCVQSLFAFCSFLLNELQLMTIEGRFKCSSLYLADQIISLLPFSTFLLFVADSVKSGEITCIIKEKTYEKSSSLKRIYIPLQSLQLLCVLEKILMSKAKLLLLLTPTFVPSRYLMYE